VDAEGRLAPVGVDPRGMAQIPQGILETEILLRMRFELDQYINLRPTRLLPNVPTPLKNAGPADIDMVIVRENTEGLYCQNGGFLYKNTPNEVANQIEVTTRRGVERAIRYAFEYAQKFNRKKVTLVAKTNVLRFAHNLGMRAFEDVKKEYASSPNKQFASPDRAALQAAWGEKWNPSAPLTMVVAPGGNVLYRKEGKFDILEVVFSRFFFVKGFLFVGITFRKRFGIIIIGRKRSGVLVIEIQFVDFFCREIQLVKGFRRHVVLLA
jgi:hypothetical protein